MFRCLSPFLISCACSTQTCFNRFRQVLYIFSYIQEYNLGVKPSAQELVTDMDIMFSVWAIYDGVTNLCISIAFIMLLYKLTTPNDSPYFKLISQLLNRVIWILAIECTGVIVANLVVLLAPAFDPLWNGIYLAESIRLRLFCMFLDMLSRILRRHVQQQRLREGTTTGGGQVPLELHSVTTGSRDQSYATISSKRPASESTAVSMQTETTDASLAASTSLKEPPQLPPRMWPAHGVKGPGLARPR
ncbi:hypothetical protein BCR44DRAFT_351059 [Catenaria anguillulae PL171]|uniref:Uncharacterized protein n=1 Tax=Catenaria anguillulae PL171 TaxID=765915 RepID=A0A1Y2HAP6_9FUNG|nr:hypothetical protein BCR44DRAFT_351059 [Catenaria anguillulae PL171]